MDLYPKLIKLGYMHFIKDFILQSYIKFNKFRFSPFVICLIKEKRYKGNNLRDIGIYIPPIDLQKEFVSFKAQVDKSKFEVQRSLDEAQTLFDSLMQEYFS